MNEKVLKRVFEHAKKSDTMRKDYTRMFTALSGSQNYGLDTENSDVDTKSIFIPNFSTLLFTKKLLSETWILDNNEHIEAKDVREMGIQLLKQGLNLVEILFTPYVDINPKYKCFYSDLIQLNEKIAHYDRQKAITSMAGMINRHCYNAFDIDRKEVNFKKLATAYRIMEQMNKYIKNYSYRDVLDMRDHRDTFLSIKNGDMTYIDAHNLARDMIKKSDNIIINYSNAYNRYKDESTAQTMFDLIDTAFRKEYGVFIKR